MRRNADAFKKARKILDKITGENTQATVTAMLIQSMLRSAAITPVATSNLVNSQYYRTFKNGTKWLGQAGYTAEYAARVHEAAGSLKGLGIKRPTRGGEDLGDYWDGANGPNSGEPKFLEKGINEMIDNDFENIVKKEYKI